MKKECGIYQIRCTVSDKSYVGSSVEINRRWTTHKYKLRKGIHHSPRLQLAWIKHGEINFEFSILELCDPKNKFEREQFYLSLKTRDYNSMPIVNVATPEMLKKRAASIRRWSDTFTHCPRGHEYTPENTYSKGRIRHLCRECNRLRVKNIVANQTPEERRKMLDNKLAYHFKNRDVLIAKMRLYRKKKV